MSNSSENYYRKEAVDVLGENAVKAVEARGYVFREQLGSGHTRIAFKGERIQGDVRRQCVIKVPSLELATDSVQARIAHNKGYDWGLEEILATNSLHHRNIVRPIDGFRIGEKSTVVVEDFIKGTRDGDKLIQWNGALSQKGRLKPLLLQVADGLNYLHGEGIVHRDLKPSNILITDSNDAYISDLQTAKPIRDVTTSVTPTRGGTPYTHPSLLNALLGNGAAGSSYATDIYSLGATTYAFLTGESPFEWKVTRKSDGSVVLREGERELGVISLEEHEQRLDVLEKRMRSKGISRPWRSQVIRSMTLDPKKKPFTTALTYKLALEDIHGGILESWRQQTLRGVKTAAIAGTVAGVAGSIILGAATVFSSRPSDLPGRSPELVERTGAFLPGNYPDRVIIHRPASDAILGLLSEKYPPLRDNFVIHNSLMKDEFFLKRFVKETHGLKPRLLTPLIYAISSSPAHVEDYRAIGQDRLRDSYVPYDFAKRNSILSAEQLNSHRESSRFELERDPTVQAVYYLKQKIDDIPPIDIYARYFATYEQIADAQIKSKSVDYFPTCNADGSIKSVGYRSALPAFQQNLIERAAAAYQITEEDGLMSPQKLKVIASQLEALSSSNVVKGEEAR